ncbi:MAG: NOG1 family protein [Candidatus Methanoperedens sp.]|nr:NOG1 family protein [Candidatus Methanoperedens sp.]
MIFEKLPTVPTSDELLNKSFRRAARAKHGKRILDRASKLKAEESMLLTAAHILSDNLINIVRKFPSFDTMPPFYLELADIIVGVEEMKMNLASVQWAGTKINEMSRKYVGMMRNADDAKVVRKQAFGRISSIVDSIDGNLRFMNDARNKLRKLPEIGEGPTIVVAGYPNVGKSSFVALVSTARPEIASYPFTTKGLAVGHFEKNKIRYQIIDTPGLLDRPLEERNEIELQAISALKHVGNVMLFIIDPSETCGYSLDKQMHLLEEIKKEFTIPMIVAANKTDISPFEGADMSMSTLTGDGVDAVLERLLELIPSIDEGLYI